MNWKVEKINFINNFTDDVDWPYQNSFIKWENDFYSKSTLWVKVYNDKKSFLILPINIDFQNRGYCPFKSYIFPYKKLNIEVLETDWRVIGAKIKEKLNLNYLEFILAVDCFNHTNMSTWFLDLNGVEKKELILNKFDKKTRNEIKKSLRSNWEIKFLNKDDLFQIYELYRENIRRHKSIAKPISYFEALFDIFGDRLWCLGVSLDGELAAVNISLVSSRRLRLLFNLSKITYWQKCVNNFIYYKMIEQGFDSGIKFFDFGPTSNKDVGHLRFKKGFGAVKCPLLRVRFCSNWRLFIFWFKQKIFNFNLRFKKIWI